MLLHNGDLKHMSTYLDLRANRSLSVGPLQQERYRNCNSLEIIWYVMLVYNESNSLHESEPILIFQDVILLHMNMILFHFIIYKCWGKWWILLMYIHTYIIMYIHIYIIMTTRWVFNKLYYLKKKKKRMQHSVRFFEQIW